MRNVCQASSGAHLNYAFVTSQKYAPRFQPLEAADQDCNAAAAEAGLPGEYRAWLSTAASYARERLSGGRGWMRPDGAPFADTIDDIAAGRILTPLLLDEFGQEVIPATAGDAVATGTNPFGLLDPGSNCHDFANDQAGNLTAGYTIATRDLWTAATSVPCGIPMRLYCFGVDQNVPLTRPADLGKIAFVSAPDFLPDQGLAAADAVCGQEAEAAGLQGEFLALLAMTAASAASRFADSPPGAVWRRVDGVTLNAPGVDLFGDDLLRAPLNVSSRGEYLGYDTLGIVLTGASSPRAVPDVSQNCENWTTIEVQAHAGVAVRVEDWFFGVDGSCNVGSRIYCLAR
jgi:hypothetical protein